MLRLASYDIVFQEVPGEVTLALNISNCPNRCKGCHSPHLWEDKGVLLNEECLSGLLGYYRNSVTCVCFMGGDAEPLGVESLAEFVRTATGGRLKTAWYSGRTKLPEEIDINKFDYIKIGPYDPRYGGLDSELTNQKLYHVRFKELVDVTFIMRKNSQKR